MKGFLSIIQGLLFIAPLLIYFGSVDDTSLYTSSFSQGELTSHDSSQSTNPPQPGETITYPNLPHETPPHDPTHGSQSSNPPQNSQTNTSSPDNPSSGHHASLSFSKYISKSGYNPEVSPLDLLLMKQMKVTVVELQGTSSALVKGGVIPIRSVKELAICALNFTKSCHSKYPADVIDLLYAFAPIYTWEAQSNFRVLYENHRNFRDYCHSIGIPVVVLEAIYPGQTFLATKPGNEPWEIQLHVEDSFYYRENFLNVAARKVDKWEYLLWIDAHQLFLNTYWWEESICKLEKYGTVQLFQYLYYMRRGGNWTDMNVNYAGIQYARYLTTPFFNYFEVLRGLWAGNAWGIRREVYKELDRILDECIFGWCDSAYNAPTFAEFEDWALVHYPGYKVYMMPWLENAGKVFKKYGVGPALVRGNIVHFDHERASKAEIERGQRAVGADPVTYNFTRDLYRDENYTLHSRKGSPTATLSTKREWK